MTKLWLIKNRKGKIFGPYTEKEVCSFIMDGEFKGDELFSSYPAGKWRPLSARSVFYEAILKKINRGSKSADFQDKSNFKDESSIQEDGEEEESPDKTQIIKSAKTDSQKKKKKSKVKIKLSEKFKDYVLEENLQDEEEEVSDVIEMEDVKEGLIKRLKGPLKLPAVLFFSLILIFAFIFFDQKKDTAVENQVRLLSISQSRKPWPQQDLEAKLNIGLSSYYKSTVSHYLNAQMQYVQILEGNPDKSAIHLHLCLVYLELWPFAHQDTRDKDVLKKILSLSNRHNPGGIYSGMCKSVQALINKKPAQALMIVNNVLGSIGSNNPIFFYYIKARALQALKQDSESRVYLRSIHKLSPKWINPYMLSANMFYDEKKYDLAGNVYQKILSVFPNHISAGLRMGVLEYKYFKKPQRSEERLNSLLVNLNELVEPNILMEAYIVLANIYLAQKDKNKALEYSNKAYALDPEHPDVILLKSKLGKEADFGNVKVQAVGLIYKGDMLAHQGNCVEAKKYFQKAYSAGKRRNARAAFRMAQCQWQTGASGQAIRWLKRAINADGKMLEAYFLLSDYLSALYDFESAKSVLAAVKSHQPSNYDLFKAYALLSFRRSQYKSAIAYAKRSLKFYTSDVDVYVLLSKAHLAIGESSKALSYANKALKEDMSSTSAHIAYALALAVTYSSEKTKNYFKQLIERFPLIIEYHQAFGEYYFNKGMYDEALEEFQLIIQKNPKFKPAYIYLGRIYSYLSSKAGGDKSDKYDQALKYFLEATLLDIADLEPLFYTGQTHLEHENYQQAEQEFEKILQSNPNYPMIHYYIGLVNFYQQGDKSLAKALKFAKTQADKTPNHFLPYKLAGDIYKLRAKGAFSIPQERKDVYELCVSEYQKALKYLKNDIEISISLIECYKGAGDLDSALQLASQLVNKKGFSGYPELMREMGSIYEAKEEYEKARSKYIEYFQLNPGAKDRKEIEDRIEARIQEKKDLSNTEGK